MTRSTSRIPSQLTLALVPDLVLMGGAMMLLLWAGWRRESAAHQRSVGIGAASCSALVTLVAVICVMRPAATTASPGPIAVDNFRWVVDIVILLGDDRRDRARASTTTTRDGHRRGRDRTCCILLASSRHDAARRGARSHDRVPRHRADVDRGLRAGGHQPPQRAVGRRRAQVLPARRVLDGVPAVRHRARLRRDRARRTSRRSAAASRAFGSATARCCSSASRCCSSASASRSPRCRSTCGRPTSTRARRRRSRRTWRRR